MKLKDKVGIRRTILNTTSSNVYRDPYNPNASIVKKLSNKFLTFYYLRQVESEFIDFKTHSILGQTREIYNQLRIAISRADRVVLRRSLSNPMYTYCEQLLNERDEKEKEKIQTLLLREAQKMKLMQARVYAADDYLKPDEIWSQLTFKVNGIDHKGAPAVQHVLFERRNNEKISYYDWKLALVLGNEELKIINYSEDEIEKRLKQQKQLEG